ncbi:MAG: 16S rRNA (cytidine(1402)-2'-O)-methyltransferase [Rhodospirillaceae bacterium]
MQTPRRSSTKPRATGAQAIAAGESSKPETPRPAPGLYVVATPIGNLGDVTARALDVLSAADVIACEDTRVTGRLLAAYGIRAAMTPYHDHNAERARPILMQRLQRGEIVALVSDAGTPLVSDPGYRLVAAAAAAGVTVTALPGASSVLAALAVAGLPTDRFLFVGFLPPRRAARREALAEIAPVRASLVVLEAPHRLAEALNDMAAVLGARAAAVARELTKLFEEVRRGSLTDLAAHYAAAGAPKGEIVIVVGPPAAGAQAAPSEAEIDARLADALEGASVRDAAAAVAADCGLPRRTVYARALALTKGRR